MSQNLLEEWHDEQNLSIVIVRHPLSRLASVYYQKFVELSTHKYWAKENISMIQIKVLYNLDNVNCVSLLRSDLQLIRSIIKRYRPKGADGPLDVPTPTEYLR